jgi:Ca2+-binding EF-hand superfamily protein
MVGRKHEDPNRRGLKARNFIDSKLRTEDGEVVPLKGDQFQEVWKHYDTDKSGFLERKEVDNFIRDFVGSSLVGIGKTLTDDDVRELRDIFLAEFDENKDGKLSIREMSHLLPVEEGFFVLFRFENGTEKGTDYMTIWKKYDRDYSGFIEAEELKTFLHDIVKRANPSMPVNEQRLDEYTNIIMHTYDSNEDGKLGLSELAKLLPPEENFVQQVLDKALSLHKLSSSDVDALLDRYDRDGSGTLEGAEMSNLARDILSITQKDGYYNASDVYDLQNSLMKGCDVNHDGRIDRRELALIITAIANAHSDELVKLEQVKRVHAGRKSQYILSYVPIKD